MLYPHRLRMSFQQIQRNRLSSGCTGTLRYACLMSIFANMDPFPVTIMQAMRSSNDTYDRLHKSLLIPPIYTVTDQV